MARKNFKKKLVSGISWLALGVGFFLIGIYLINSDLVALLLKPDTLFPFLLGGAAVLTLIKRTGLSTITAVVFLGFGAGIFLAGKSGYSEESLGFENAGIVLEGTLYFPKGEGPFPAVAIAHGSPCVPRRLYHVFAVDLAKKGIAVLSYDKRGTGNSGGTCLTDNNASFENLDLLAGDLAAGLEKLSQTPDIDPTRIGIWGISQGGWIAPLAAEKFAPLAFMVLVSGPTVSVGEENYYSALTGDYHEDPENDFGQEDIEALVDAENPSGFDPYPLLEELEVPALWVFGGKDRSIPVQKSLVRLDELKALGKPYDTVVFPKSSHILIEMGFPFNFSKGFQNLVAQWIKDQKPGAR